MSSQGDNGRPTLLMYGVLCKMREMREIGAETVRHVHCKNGPFREQRQQNVTTFL